MLNFANLLNKNVIASPSISTEFSLLTLDSVADLTQVVELIGKGKIAIVLLKLDQRTSKRVIDWLNGYILAINGVSQWLGEKTFLFANQDCKVTGVITTCDPFNREPSALVSTTIKQIFVELSQDNLLGMVYIPEGNFEMGSPLEDVEASLEETPVHSVTVSGFYLSQYPITQVQWRTVASLPRVHRHLKVNPSYFTGDSLPVEQISWYDALEFCDRLSQYTGRLYRLPSEAEWEYSCRAGSRARYWFGQIINSDLANYDAHSGYGMDQDQLFLQKTTPVDYFKLKNPFGLGDLHGNVWEWCSDHWHPNYHGAPTDGSPWLSEHEEQLRIIRGGSWYDLPRFCRSACRYALTPHRRVNNVGFRIACNSLN